jgi:hypothetical protein
MTSGPCSAELEVGKRHHRPPERDGRAVVEHDVDGFVADHRAALGRHAAGNAPVLQLVAIDGMRVRPAVRVRAGDRELEEHAEHGLAGEVHGGGAAVVDVAMDAAVLVEGGAEAPDTGGIGGNDPGFAELLLTLEESLALRATERGYRRRVGRGSDLQRREGARGQDARVDWIGITRGEQGDRGQHPSPRPQ